MAETPYTYSVQDDFPNHKVDPSRLQQEIQGSAIVTAMYSIFVGGDDCVITFKDALSSGDETILDGIVAAHSGEPLVPEAPIQKVKQVDTCSLDPDQAHTRLRGYSFEAAGKDQGTDGKWTEFNFTIPYSIDLLMGEGPAPAEGQQGDVFEFYVSPDTVVGALTADAAEDAELAHVSPTVLGVMKPGFFVGFGPGNPIHEVVSVDQINGTISFTPPLEADRAAGTYVLLTIVYCETIHITPGEELSLGGQTAGSTPVAAGTGMRVRYYNTSETAVTVQFRLIYKY